MALQQHAGAIKKQPTPQHTGVIKKQPNFRKSVRIQKEQPPVCGIAHPGNVEWFADKNSQDNKYKNPQLNSILKLRQEIESIEGLQTRTLKNTGDLTPRSKNAIIPKINQKLNFDVNRPVFRNLVSINVNDSLLLPTETTSIRKKYNVKSTTKPPAPELCDFLDPLPPQTHVVPVSKITLQFPNYEYDVLAACKRFTDDD